MSKKSDILSVSELNDKIKNTIEQNFQNTLKVKGEISSLKISGKHCYFVMKDSASSINMIMWNYVMDLKQGDDVVVTGKMNCFQKNGTYNVSAFKIEKIGIGNIYEEFEINKKKFESKGYFAKSMNPIEVPKVISRIGILTASEGAAIQDVLYVLKNNGYHGDIYIKNCNVQGTLCPDSVKQGIKYFNKLHKKKQLDVLLITRGGGSFEDLSGYSHKKIVKEIYKTKIYTISAIGHEVDTMLSDYASNYRSPTPSIAGEVISESYKTKKESLHKNKLPIRQGSIKRQPPRSSQLK